MKQIIKAWVFIILSMSCAANLLASSLKSDEHVLFVPDFSYVDENGSIAVNVQAWVYEKERRPGFTTILAKFMDIDKDELSKAEYDKLYQRSALFRVDSENGKNLKIIFENGQIFEMPQTEDGGRSNLSAILQTNTGDFSNNKKIAFNLHDSGSPSSVSEAISFFYSKEGLSVISDIDDTIKDSNVLNQKELLKNTFLYEFKAIAQMNELFNDINEGNNNSVAFHYVSSSPIQLYPVIDEFLNKHRFPRGSVHLRDMSGWDTLLFSESKEHKLDSIKRILGAYPHRKFILVGDSGELDPEIYAQILKEYGNQIEKIIIRNVTNENRTSARYKIFGKEKAELLQIVDF